VTAAFLDIIGAVARDAGVSADSILGPAARGCTSANWPRQRAVLLLRRIRPDLSWKWLAARFNRRQFSDLCCAYSAAERRLAASADERATCDRLVRGLGLPALPDRREAQELAAVDRKIRDTELLLFRLRARKGRLIEQLAA
jgi:hypothetical protein